MTGAASNRDLVALRLHSLLLSRPLPAAADPVDGVADTARRLLAAQGQDPIAVQWALGSRTGGADQADVAEAFRRGLIVRSWPMRGTVHVLAAEDLGWLQALTNPRALAAANRRREFLGLDLAVLERMREIAAAALEGGRALSRAELIAEFERHDITMRQGWAYHSIWFLAQTGTLVFGPPSGGRENLLVRVDEWIPAPRALEGDEALAELAARYVGGHGPATVADLCWWTKLTVTSVKRAFAVAEDAGRVQRLEVDGTSWWAAADADTVDVAPIPDLRLLGAFDETLMGFADRTLFLARERWMDVMSSNGISSPTILLDGRIAGAWSRRSGAVVLDPFPDTPPINPDAIERESARVEAFFATD